MAIFNSKLLVYQRVFDGYLMGCFLDLGQHGQPNENKYCKRKQPDGGQSEAYFHGFFIDLGKTLREDT